MHSNDQPAGRFPLPPRPSTEAEEAPRRAWWFIWFGFVLAALAAVGLMFILLPLPMAIGILAIGGCAVLVPTFHYLLWGHWLSGAIRDEVEAEESDGRGR